ncbi:hypothetical protein [Niabella drilacis]|uniref:hypothetical protein n=1 Tax=Niabella drilacis (strain DSM 25811 / CCM 8410 / CCUG 62505 / LMG 26954 / E90) TaxID=1285928 RepID=UPI00115FE18F|nr:hypothetical protein [Niabella drilacis]
MKEHYPMIGFRKQLSIPAYSIVLPLPGAKHRLYECSKNVAVDEGGYSPICAGLNEPEAPHRIGNLSQK